MANQIARFLEAYRRLEAVAPRVLTREQQRAGGGVIARLLRHPKFAPYREELDCCREVRNLLTHEVQIEGHPAVVPSEAMIAFVDRMVELIENPKRVRDRMTPLARLVVVERNTQVKQVMEQMWTRGLSRVPLLKEGVVRGMFSMEAIFHATMDGVVITPQTLVGDIRDYLPLDGAPNTHYTFVSPETTLEVAEEIFQSGQNKKTKLRALLVTEGGNPSAPLIGILTPYDILGQ